MKKAIVTVVGDDKVGIISSVATKLSQYQINILDITQTIMKDDVFVMLALVDVEQASAPFHEVREGLEALGRTMGLSIRIQREDIFNSMHKV